MEDSDSEEIVGKRPRIDNQDIEEEEEEKKELLNESNVKEWSIDDVAKFITKQFGDKIADKFREEEVNGRVLLTERIKNETTMERLSLVTVGKQERFKSIVDRLKGKVEVDNSGSRKIDQGCHHKEDRLLTHKEKLQLKCEEKTIYNTKKKLITQKIKEKWPESKPTPSFRNHNIDEVAELNEFVKSLSESGNKYMFPACALGPLAIRQMVMNHMRERRRNSRMSAIYVASGNTTTESEVDTETDTSSTTSGGTPPPLKKPEYLEYFHPEFTQASCDVIILEALQKLNTKDVHMLKDLTPLKNKFRLTLLRGRDKNTNIRAIANSLYSNGYITIKDGADLKNLTRNDIVRVKPI